MFIIKLVTISVLLSVTTCEPLSPPTTTGRQVATGTRRRRVLLMRRPFNGNNGGRNVRRVSTVSSGGGHQIPEGTVRLVGGQHQWEGNVEIYHMGRWGSVCDDEWDLMDGHVVCKSLGYTAGAQMATNNAQFGRSRKLIWMDNVYCSSTERTLSDCQFDGWKIHDCTTNEAAGVVCKTTTTTTTSNANNNAINNTNTNSISPMVVVVTTNNLTASGGGGSGRIAYNGSDISSTGSIGGGTTAASNSSSSSSSERRHALLFNSISNDEPIPTTTTTTPSTTTPTTTTITNSVVSTGRNAKIRTQWTGSYNNNNNKDINLRLSGGQHRYEGRVEIRFNNDDNNQDWRLVCGDGWSLLESMVVCRQLGLGYASHAIQTNVFGSHNLSLAVSGLRCKGYEKGLADCEINSLGGSGGGVGDDVHSCPVSHHNVAGVMCTSDLPDLVPDEREIERSAYLEDRMLLLLQCAMEENCLASSAYTIVRNEPGWQFETRRLLRFTARIANIGTADFRPFLPKHTWDWHQCHRHYHSMEVFAHFDILDGQGRRVAEGHKASFCLEDNNCKDNGTRKYACANYGDQGISVGCVDTYLYNIDCQWIDITDLPPGVYQLKVSINPEFKVSELSFDNNAALCSFYYNTYMGRVYNCTLTRP
ncbi:lysyl oxidase homolog 3-like [Oppia nitens]|uniref:lysyl oxidase homolog 3-like n=1 Tax=Oppia nitens TaxID=1686743 RepID=UPI0023DA5963|nr:lysyl oxidase homolog 3-like [Oppia nitens]